MYYLYHQSRDLSSGIINATSPSVVHLLLLLLRLSIETRWPEVAFVRISSIVDACKWNVSVRGSLVLLPGAGVKAVVVVTRSLWHHH